VNTFPIIKHVIYESFSLMKIMYMLLPRPPQYITRQNRVLYTFDIVLLSYYKFVEIEFTSRTCIVLRNINSIHATDIFAHFLSFLHRLHFL
jgi:hypothetical protein